MGGGGRGLTELTEEQRNLIGWLERRVIEPPSALSSIGVIRFYVKQFEEMWIEANGPDVPIPQGIKERVNAKIRDIKAKREAAGL